MARLGMNPAKTKRSTYWPARVTVATMVHIPNFVGYYEHRFPVLKACLHSIIENTTAEHDLLVLDNGSCEEVRDYLVDLLDKGAIDFLIRTKVNLGKLAGLKMIFRSAPGELVAYTDDDFYFFPGWLQSQLRILDTFPNVGAVSGYAVPSFFERDRIASNLRFAESDPEVQVDKGSVLRSGIVRDWAVSTGRDPNEAVREIDKIPQVRLTYRGVQALAAANHDQFLAPKNVILEAMPEGWSDRLMGGMLEMDKAIDKKGYLRLTTIDRTTQHLGNVIDHRILQSIPEIPRLVSTKDVEVRVSSGFIRRLAAWPPIRTVLLGVYSRLFRLIHPE